MTSDLPWFFPFGQPVRRVVQQDRRARRIFILGVYGSAVHAAWIGADGRRRLGTVAVASEPEIFWTGDSTAAQAIVGSIVLPAGTGHLIPASGQLNGRSGRALDEYYLTPLGLAREQSWLCDLVPHSCMNRQQEASLARAYNPARVLTGLPLYNWPRVRDCGVDSVRFDAIERELSDSGADILITLGDAPLKSFSARHGGANALRKYGSCDSTYGRFHRLVAGGRELRHLPLVHPRQAAGVGVHSTAWRALHARWVARAGALSADI